MLGYISAVLGVVLGVLGAVIGYNVDHSWFGLLAGVFFPLALLGGLFTVAMLGFGLRAAQQERKGSRRPEPPPR